MAATSVPTSDLSGKTILLGVTGGIAAYKSCELVRLLQKRGAHVKVAMTEHAAEFIGPVTFRALTHESVAMGLFDDPNDPIHHISLAQEPDLVIVAPATANIIAKMASGIADDLLSTTLLATPKPILLAPAMNNGMWKAPATQDNMLTLRERGVAVVGPGRGYLACGDVDEGRMSSPGEIADAAESLLCGSDDYAGKRVLITAGPTYEPIDPVRFIGNRSSGLMGACLARAAVMRGAQVDLVLGPTHIEPPTGCNVVHVETSQQMFDAAHNLFSSCDLAVCAAAVADYRPVSAADHKLKKQRERLSSIDLVETQDILAHLSSHKGSRTVIGFAAETDDVLAFAQDKLLRKGCDLIVANDVSRSDSGFGTQTDKAFLVSAEGIDELPVLSKLELAHRVLDRAKSFSK